MRGNRESRIWKWVAVLAALVFLISIGLLFWYAFAGTPSELKCELVDSDGRRACP
ncbi:hypothetical protein [Streptomyces sp. NPDC059819]|uniref:hypothetical protein n=1 Tax=Streptomyces sp. NPDC059819 TaxID=3346963 RepID=UPI0036546C64